MGIELLRQHFLRGDGSLNCTTCATAALSPLALTPEQALCLYTQVTDISEIATFLRGRWLRTGHLTQYAEMERGMQPSWFFNEVAELSRQDVNGKFLGGLMLTNDVIGYANAEDGLIIEVAHVIAVTDVCNGIATIVDTMVDGVSFDEPNSIVRQVDITQLDGCVMPESVQTTRAIALIGSQVNAAKYAPLPEDYPDEMIRDWVNGIFFEEMALFTDWQIT